MKKNKLELYVSLGQIISSLAVVISIVYLVSEYNRSQVLNNRSVENFVYDRMVELDRLLIENPDLAEISHKAKMQPDSLSDADRARYLAWEHIFYDTWEALWVNYQDGLVRGETWEEWNTWFVSEAKRRPAFGLEGNLVHYLSGSNPFRKHLEESMR